MSANQIFISWSKEKSRKLGEATKIFLEKIFSSSIKFFFSPEMYKGTCVDNEIHSNLLSCQKCIVCITAENFKNPWLHYEAGVIYGANSVKSSNSIIIPVLFENIPNWSSWIDKPLNRYVPLQIQDYNGNFSEGKRNFRKFIEQTIKDFSLLIEINDSTYEKEWIDYETKVKQILSKDQLIPLECKDLYNRILENDNGNFSVISPEVTKDKVTFFKGFTTNTLIKILLETIQLHQGKYLWFYGRKNKKLFSRENDDFFKFLAEEGLSCGVDFKCLFVMPHSSAAVKASSKDRNIIFDDEMRMVLYHAINLKNKYGLPIETLFHLYTEPRTESLIRCDNVILYRYITRDSEGYPLPYTNSDFEMFSAIKDKENRGENCAINKFINIWENEVRSKPLTVELYNNLFPAHKI